MRLLCAYAIRCMLRCTVCCGSGRTTRTPSHLKNVTLALCIRSKTTNLEEIPCCERTNPISADIVSFELRSSADLCCNDQTYADSSQYLFSHLLSVQGKIIRHSCAFSVANLKSLCTSSLTNLRNRLPHQMMLLLRNFG